MSLLHIYDANDSLVVQTALQRGAANQLPILDADNLATELDKLLAGGSLFKRILFETHGAPGRISFGGKIITSCYWQAIKGRWNNLVTTNSRIYFNGCNVAETEAGWTFLESVAGVFMTSGGGKVFGQDSLGFGNPFNGHTVHLWGSTRTVFVDNNGNITERFEQ